MKKKTISNILFSLAIILNVLPALAYASLDRLPGVVFHTALIALTVWLEFKDKNLYEAIRR